MSRRGSRRRQGTIGRTGTALLALGLLAYALLAQRQGDEVAPRPQPAIAAAPAGASGQLPAFLPAEAGDTLRRIASGGPFPYAQDGTVFGNFEGHLPREPRGWYHEYTVPTPGLSHRGTRRIVTGGTPPSTYWYTGDHYASFRRFDPGMP